MCEGKKSFEAHKIQSTYKETKQNTPTATKQIMLSTLKLPHSSLAYKRLFMLFILATVGIHPAAAAMLRRAATTLSTTQAQWNLAGLGYLSYTGIDGIAGPKTADAASNFQTDQCLYIDGIVGPLTSESLITVMKQVQAKVGAVQDGFNGANTKSKIIAYQQANGLVADGMAGPLTFSKMDLKRVVFPCGNTSSNSLIVGDIYTPSTTVPCATGTTDLGTGYKAYSQGVEIAVRLCAIPGFKSSSEESTPGSAYYISGSNGNVIVNSRVSGAVLAMFNKAKSQGLTLTANSSFRTMDHQTKLCNADAACKNGSYKMVAKPGFSMHQLSVAIDFAGPTASNKDATCSNRVTAYNSPVWVWLMNNANAYGYRQYAAESWHWDPLVNSVTRC